MSGDRYHISDQNAIYFLTFTVVGWIDVFSWVKGLVEIELISFKTKGFRSPRCKRGLERELETPILIDYSAMSESF